MKQTTYMKFVCVLLIAVLTGLFGCQSVTSFFVGGTVDPDLRIPLAAGSPRQGTWETFDLAIDYAVDAGSEDLRISGSALLGEHYRLLYTRLKQLDVYLFFLTSDATVLETVLLTSSLSSRIDQQLEFAEVLPLPAGTSAISFGYRGEVTSLDSHDYFHELP